MSIVLDLIVISIIILMILISAKRGFVRVAVEVAGFVVAIMLSFTLSATLADFTYQKVIEPAIVSSVENITVETTDSAAENTWNALPDFIKNSSVFESNYDDLSRYNKLLEDAGIITIIRYRDDDKKKRNTYKYNQSYLYLSQDR